MVLDEQTEVPIEIPVEQVSQESLMGIIENFVMREGTDYGWVEITHAKKIEQVLRQLKQGEIKIVFDTKAESVSLMTASEWKKLNRR